MRKYVYIEFSPTEIYKIPATHIAARRASFLMEHDEHGRHIDSPSMSYDDRIIEALSNNDILLDWVRCGLDWFDISFNENVLSIKDNKLYEDYDLATKWVQIDNDF